MNKTAHKQRSLGDVIEEVLERANQKSRSKSEQKYPVKIIYGQKIFTVKGKKETYHVFALEIDGTNKVVSKIKQIGKWSGIKQLSGKTIINYAAKGKAGKNISRETVSDVIKLFSKIKDSNVKVGIDQTTVMLEDREYFKEVLKCL